MSFYTVVPEARCLILNSITCFFKKIDDKLTRMEELLVAVLLFVMTSVIFLSVLERFFFQFGFTKLEEFARYLSVWAAFIGSALAVKKGAHIGIEAFVQMLPSKGRRIEELLVDIVGMIFSAVVFYIGIGFLGKLIETNQLSPAMRINVAWAYGAVPIGCALMGVHYTIKFIAGASCILGYEKDREGTSV